MVVVIQVQGSDGGNRCVLPPNNCHGKKGEEQDDSGGQRGRGGSVYLMIHDNGLSSLVPLQLQIHFNAQNEKKDRTKTWSGPVVAILITLESHLTR